MRLPAPPSSGLVPSGSQAVVKRDLTADDILQIRNLWNSIAEANGLPTARTITGQRLARLRARVRDHGLAGVVEAIISVPNAPFLLGANDRGWRADFDFLVQERSFGRILEGFYTRLKQRAGGDLQAERATRYARDGAVHALERMHRRGQQ